MFRKAVVLSLAIMLFCSITVPAFAAESAVREIPVIDIGVRPSAYKHLISAEDRSPYPITVSVDDGGYQKAKILTRGSSSREIGLLAGNGRLPFELVFDNTGILPNLIDNTSVKLVNSFTVNRLIMEYLALELFEQSGVPTPSHCITFLQFNGVDFGLYLAVEDVNEIFLSRCFPGNIYSAYKATNKEKPQTAYITSKWFGKMFAKTECGANNLYHLLAALDAGKEYEDYLDVDEILRYFACTAVIGGEGSILTELNNFVLYDNNGKFVLIPWDLSEAFTAVSLENGIDRFVLSESGGTPSALFDLLMQNPAYKETYHDMIRKINDSFMDPQRLTSVFNDVFQRIAPYLPQDHTIFFNPGNEKAALEQNGVNTIQSVLPVLLEIHNNLSAQLEGTEDTFFVNYDYEEMTSVDSAESLIAYWKSHSPVYDPDMPQAVMAAYSVWASAFYKNGFFDIYSEVLLALGVFAAGAMILFVSYLPKRRARIRR